MEHKKKLKQKLHEIKTLNSSSPQFCSPGPSDLSKKKKKMQLENTKKGSLKKPRSYKSKGKQVSPCDSKKSQSNARKRTNHADLYDDKEAQCSVEERAAIVLSHLESECPFFSKCMLPSNVDHGFWMHLPKSFCSVYLPNHDTSIMLVDEWGKEYKTSYLIHRHGLSAGWRKFSISHGLLQGDILIFHLIEPCKFKVHIVRVNGSDVVNAALCLLSLHDSARGMDVDLAKKNNRRRRKRTFVDPFPTPSKKVKGNNATKSVSHQPASNSDGSEITNEPQQNDPHCSKALFLQDQSREGVTYR